MTSRLVAVLLLALAGCTCGDGTIPPSAVRTADLEGYWVVQKTETEPQRVFGFFSQADAPWMTRVTREEATGPVSDVHIDGRLSQLTLYEVKEGALLQTVIDDVAAAPGTRYSTKLDAFTPGKALRLITADGGTREYGFAPRCPIVNSAGWQGAPLAPCGSLFHVGVSLAVDRTGAIHGTTSINDIRQGADRCALQPAYTVLAGCESRFFELPHFAGSSVVVDDDADVVHVFFSVADVGAPIPHPSGTLVHRWRPLRGETWQEEIVGQPRFPHEDVIALLHGGTPVVITQRAGDPVLLYDLADGAWRQREVTVEGQGPLRGRLAGADVDSQGRVVLLITQLPVAMSMPGLYRQATGATVVALPRLPGDRAPSPSGLFIDAQDRVHVLGPAVFDDGALRPAYAILSGTSWTLFETGPQGPLSAVLRSAEPPWRLLRTITPGERWGLTEIAADGTRRTTLVSESLDIGAASLSTPAWGKVASVRGRDGTIVTTLGGAGMQVLHPGQVTPPGRATLTLTLEGTGTGRVVDEQWGIDCRDTCTVELPSGAVPSLRLLADEGSEPGPSVVLRRGTSGILTPLVPATPARGFDLPIDGQELMLRVPFVLSTVRRRVEIGAPGTQQATHFDAAGSRFVVAVNSADGGVAVDGVDHAAAPGTGPLLVLREGTATRAARLEAPVVAVSLLDQGGAHVLLEVDGVATVGGEQVGTAQRRTLVWQRYDGMGQRSAQAVFPTLPSGPTRLNAVLDRAGGAAAHYTRLGGFADLGVTQSNLLLRRALDGTLHAQGVGFSGTPMQASLAVSGNAVAVASAFATQGELATFDGLQANPVRAVTDGSARALLFHEGKLWSLWRAFSSFTFDGALRQPGTAQWVAVRSGLNGAQEESFAVPDSSTVARPSVWLVGGGPEPLWAGPAATGLGWGTLRGERPHRSLPGFSATATRAGATTDPGFWALGQLDGRQLLVEVGRP